MASAFLSAMTCTEGIIDHPDVLMVITYLIHHIFLNHLILLHDLNGQLLVRGVLSVAEKHLPKGPSADRFEDVEVMDSRGQTRAACASPELVITPDRGLTFSLIHHLLYHSLD